MLPNGMAQLEFDGWGEKEDVFFRMAGMRLAIVGSAKLTAVQIAAAAQIVCSALEQYKPVMVISGGADGVDLLAENYARLKGIAVHIHHPSGPTWKFYRERNLRIANECDALIRIVKKGSKTYGSGWTRDRAKEMGKPTKEFVIE